MMHRSTPFLWSTLFACSLATLCAAGCRDGEDDTGGSTTTGTNDGGNGAGTSDGAGTDGGNGTGGEDVAGCEGPEATVQGIATGEFGPGAKVTVSDVVVMSHKFLVSKSSTTDNCLWGAFVSAPGLSETEANSGLLILSYGFKASIPEGGTQAFCPRLGQDPAGDKIPDDVKPGDVLQVVGTVSRFPEDPECTGDNPPNQVGMLQLGSVCKAEITGAATPPAAHVMSAADAEGISSTTDQAFHDQWGAVKVRFEDVGVTPADGMVVGEFGVITLDNGVEVGDKIYYRGYSNNKCHEGPVFPDVDVTYDYVEGFHYLAFCSWGIQANDKCADFSPQSGDCTADTCAPDFIGD